jgi:AcrR family transcriptional regulator
MTHIYPDKPGVKGRKDARVERTRGALRDALLELLEEHPFDQLTIRDISARASAGYATFFRHYPDKASLLADLASAEISELLAHAMPILVSVDTHASCVALCSYVNARRRLWAVLLTGGAAANLREEFVRQARVLASETSADHSRPQSWLPADIAVTFGVSGTVEILAWWLDRGSAHSIEEVASILDRLVIAPILQP